MIWFYVSTCVLFSTIVGFHVMLAHLGETRAWNSHVIRSISRRKTVLLKSKDEYSLIENWSMAMSLSYHILWRLPVLVSILEVI